MSMLGNQPKPERICIVDNNGVIVRLNDRERTELRFNKSEEARAQGILIKMNAYKVPPGCPNRGPYRLIPLVEQ